MSGRLILTGFVMVTAFLLFASPIFAADTSCPDYCRAGVHYFNGTFNSKTGQCEYSWERCTFGCNEDGTACAAPPTGQCPDYCRDGVYHTKGTYNSTTRQCEYKEIKCEFGCDARGIKCAVGKQEVKCRDSDGRNIYRKGITIGWDASKTKIVTSTDYCTDKSGGPELPSGKWVAEEQCDEQDRVHTYYYECPENYWCVDGKCVYRPAPKPALTCEERMKKIIKETCLDQGVDKAVCDERYRNLVNLECKKEEIKKPILKLTVCQSLRARLINLTQAIAKSESDKEKAMLREQFVEAKKEYTEKCVRAIPAKVPRIDICRELENMRALYASLSKRERHIKDLLAEGKANIKALDEIQKKKRFLKMRIERIERICKAKRAYHESPCLALSTMAQIAQQLNERAVAGENVSERLEKIEEQIIKLRKECARQRLAKENASSLVEAEEIYKSKLLAIAEQTSAEEVDKNLQQMEEEKNSLVKAVAQKVDKLDLRNIELIKRVKIGRQAHLDNVTTNKPVVVDIYIQNKQKQIYIKPGKEVLIESDNVSAKSEFELIYVNKSFVSAKNKPIRILPSDIKAKVPGSREIKLVNEAAPKYIAVAPRMGRLLGVIPVSFDVNFELDANKGNIIAKRKPWWTFLVFGESNPQPSPAPVAESNPQPSP